MPWCLQSSTTGLYCQTDSKQNRVAAEPCNKSTFGLHLNSSSNMDAKQSMQAELSTMKRIDNDIVKSYHSSFMFHAILLMFEL